MAVIRESTDLGNKIKRNKNKEVTIVILIKQFTGLSLVSVSLTFKCLWEMSKITYMALSVKRFVPRFLRISSSISPQGVAWVGDIFLDDGSLDVSLGVLEKLYLKGYLISILKISLLYL